MTAEKTLQYLHIAWGILEYWPVTETYKRVEHEQPYTLWEMLRKQFDFVLSNFFSVKNTVHALKTLKMINRLSQSLRSLVNFSSQSLLERLLTESFNFFHFFLSFFLSFIYLFISSLMSLASRAGLSHRTNRGAIRGPLKQLLVSDRV